jgi:hypothetical protein
MAFEAAVRLENTVARPTLRTRTWARSAVQRIWTREGVAAHTVEAGPRVALRAGRAGRKACSVTAAKAARASVVLSLDRSTTTTRQSGQESQNQPGNMTCLHGLGALARVHDTPKGDALVLAAGPRWLRTAAQRQHAFAARGQVNQRGVVFCRRVRANLIRHPEHEQCIEEDAGREARDCRSPNAVG